MPPVRARPFPTAPAAFPRWSLRARVGTLSGMAITVREGKHRSRAGRLRVPAPGRALGVLLLVLIIVSLRVLAEGAGRVAWVGPAAPARLRDAVGMAAQVVLALGAVMALRRTGPAGALRELGLLGDPARGALLGFAATIPVLVGFAVAGGVRPGIGPVSLLVAAVAVPLSEDVLFRGLLFRQLRQRLRWRFWPASGTAAIAFAATYLVQAGAAGLGIAGTVGLLAVAWSYGVLAAWLFERWHWDLWMALGFHAFANLWGSLFDAGPTILGRGPALAAVLLGGAIAVGLSLLGTRDLRVVTPRSTG